MGPFRVAAVRCAIPVPAGGADFYYVDTGLSAVAFPYAARTSRAVYYRLLGGESDGFVPQSVHR
ncbi:hypothetical protein D3C85_1809900 [compost metagenome]